jgi:hypothetical protein
MLPKSGNRFSEKILLHQKPNDSQPVRRATYAAAPE